jgi:hypothetical protein
MPEMCDWFDSDVWRERGNGEYRTAVFPEELLVAVPESIWPGLMPPDFLPLLANDAGDWLCARLGCNQKIVEIVQWYHGGGDWIPWGNSLAEAILFDAISDLLPGLGRRHAEPAEPLRSDDLELVSPHLDWALHWLPPAISNHIVEVQRYRLEKDHDKVEQVIQSLLEVMLANNISQIPLRSEWVQRAISSDNAMDMSLSESVRVKLGFTEAQWNRQLFDLQFLGNTNTNDTLVQLFPSSILQQDWRRAGEHCERVTCIAPHLAWGWDLLGYSQYRERNHEQAANSFLRGLQASVFTDQSIRFRTHWANAYATKFSAAMLFRLIEENAIAEHAITSRVDAEYLDVLRHANPSHRSQATQYWLNCSQRSIAAQRWNQAWNEVYAAGWDLGADSISTYATVLDQLILVSDSLGDPARGELARTHRACLSERFGVNASRGSRRGM